MAPFLLVIDLQASSCLGQRSDSLPFGKSGPYPISLTQMSQVSGQATAEPVRVTMPSLKTGLLAPSTAQVGEASCASFDLGSRSLGSTGVVLALRVTETTSPKRQTPFPVGWTTH